MKPGDNVPVNDELSYKPYRKNLNGYSERCDGKVILKAGTRLFHVSYYYKIKELASCYTCFSIESPVLTTGYVYVVELLEDIECELYECGRYEYDEYRFVPTSENCTCTYIGTMQYRYLPDEEWELVRKISSNRTIGYRYNFGNTPVCDWAKDKCKKSHVIGLNVAENRDRLKKRLKDMKEGLIHV